MKTILKIQYLLLFLFSCFLMTGCLSDGDETIALEQGDAHKMIRGKWRFSNTRGSLPETFKWKEGTIITFYGDGTYTDSNDEDRTRHRWILNEGGDGIKLDDTGFGIDSWGKDHWRFHYPYGSNNPTWRGGLEHEDGPDGYDKPGATPEPEPEPDPEPDPEPEGEYLVKSIKYKNTYDKTYEYTFKYDGEGRIRLFYDAISKNTYEYEYGDHRLRVLTTSDNSDKSPYSIEYSLDDYGRIKEETFGSFFYNEEGYLQHYTDWHYEDYYYTWGPDAISKWTKDNYRRWWGNISSEANDSNIDINPFLITCDNNPSWLRSLAPYGFLGKKYPTVIYNDNGESYDWHFENTADVLRNEHHLISWIERVQVMRHTNEYRNTETFDIEYSLLGTEDCEILIKK